MIGLFRSARPLAGPLVCALLLPITAQAQLISLKTVPVAAGDQFDVFPSARAGMAGVSIALDDRLADPFVNPAKGARVRTAQLFTTPTFFDVSGPNGAGRSLPAGFLFTSRQWFGALALTLQELEAPGDEFDPIVLQPGIPNVRRLSDKSASNLYAFAMSGFRIPDSDLSIGGSVFWAGLDALEGVDLLYAGSQRVEQSGHLLDLRLGVLGELEGERSYEALLVHSRLDMTHDVTYAEWVFDDVIGEWVVREERNLDRTNTWGLHLGYVQPLAPDGWRLGGIFTTNYKEHPKIPNYEIMNIPRDPGNSWAFNLGVGVSRSVEPATFAVDLIFEPIWSETWAEAGAPIITAGGERIPRGGKTVDNDFVFTNALMRLGFGIESEQAEFQLGLQVRSIDYRLEQTDLVEGTYREQQESWKEWTPSLGFALKFTGVEFRYSGRVTTGTGQPGVAWTDVGVERTFAAADADFIVAPSGPLTLQDADVYMHQVAVVLPIRGG